MKKLDIKRMLSTYDKTPTFPSHMLRGILAIMGHIPLMEVRRSLSAYFLLMINTIHLIFHAL